jgi:hypothetical protein
MGNWNAGIRVNTFFGGNLWRTGRNNFHVQKNAAGAAAH